MGWNEEQLAWFKNKTKAGIAEAACKVHFQALGFSVENTGIEHIAPSYIALSHTEGLGHYIAGYREKLNRMPDFLASRVYADTQINRKKNMVGKKDAIFIDAKYREAVDLNSFSHELYSTYGKLIEDGLPLLIYLVTPAKPYVRLLFFSKSVYQTSLHCSPWSNAGDPMLAALPLYQGNSDDEHFNSAYEHILEPALEELLRR